MYRLMLIEDEPIERQGIRLMLANNCPALESICEAADGLEAIALCREYRPHIALVDIHMPGLNGLETIKALHDIDPAICCMILTSHERFEFAHEAIRLGVEDYILKPARIARLREAVEKVIEKLEHTAAENDRQTALIQRMNKFRPILERDCVYSLVAAGDTLSLEAFQFLDFDVQGGFCFLVQARENDELLARVRQSFATLGLCCIGERVAGKYVFFVFFRPDNGDLAHNELVEFALSAYKRGEPALRVGVSARYLDALSLQHAYTEALIAFEEADSPGADDATAMLADVERALGELQHTLAAKDLFQQKVAQIAREFEKSPSRAGRAMQALLECFWNWLYARGSAANQSAAVMEAPKLPGNESPRRIALLFQNELMAMAQRVWSTGDAFSQTLIGRVLEYIESNYMKNLSLDMLADEFHISPFYVSRMMKLKVGSSFPDVLAQRRIREAKRLLQQGESIKSVTYEVGFSSQNYFGKIFKKQTGLTPSEYRARNLL